MSVCEVGQAQTKMRSETSDRRQDGETYEQPWTQTLQACLARDIERHKSYILHLVSWTRGYKLVEGELQECFFEYRSKVRIEELGESPVERVLRRFLYSVMSMCVWLEIDVYKEMPINTHSNIQ